MTNIHEAMIEDTERRGIAVALLANAKWVTSLKFGKYIRRHVALAILSTRAILGAARRTNERHGEVRPDVAMRRMGHVESS
jgi:hypothetical protein